MSGGNWAVAAELFLFAVCLWGVLDALLRPKSAWEEVGQRRIVWVLIQVVFWFIGTVLYFAIVRWRFNRVHERQGDGEHSLSA